MKISAVVAMFWMTPVLGATTVCLKGAGSPAVANAFAQARRLSAQLFARIGVSIDWRIRAQDCPPYGIRISNREQTSEHVAPHALAVALPYEGTHIRVFFDRICQNRDERQVAVVLACVCLT